MLIAIKKYKFYIIKIKFYRFIIKLKKFNINLSPRSPTVRVHVAAGGNII